VAFGSSRSRHRTAGATGDEGDNEKISIHRKKPRMKKGSPYSITERGVPELIPVLSSQPAGDVSHKPDGIAVRSVTLPHRYGKSRATYDHTVLPATWQDFWLNAV